MLVDIFLTTVGQTSVEKIINSCEPFEFGAAQTCVNYVDLILETMLQHEHLLGGFDTAEKERSKVCYMGLNTLQVHYMDPPFTVQTSLHGRERHDTRKKLELYWRTESNVSPNLESIQQS